MPSLAECLDKGKIPQDIRDEIAEYGDDIAAVEAYLADIRGDLAEVANQVGLPTSTVERSSDLRIVYAGAPELGDTFDSRRSFFQGNYTPDSLEGFIASQPEMFHVELRKTAEAERAAQAGRGVADEDAVLRQVQFMAEILRTKALKDGQRFMQENGGPKGMIELVEDGYAIMLFPAANQSTLLHETGHLFLEEMRTLIKTGLASEQTQADWATISEYLGNDGTALTRAQHELWARSFEAYLREGKAPSVELEGAFSTFRRWLTEIYQSVKQLIYGGVVDELTPGVRMVMDRMLATDQQIEQLATVNGLKASLGKMRDVPAVDEGRRSRLQRLIDSGARQMADALWRKRTKHTRDRITARRKEIKAEMSRERVYQAWDAITKAGGLNRAQLEAEYGDIGILVEKGLVASLTSKEAKAAVLEQPVYAAIDFMKTKGGLRLATVREDFGQDTVNALRKAHPGIIAKVDETGNSPESIASSFGFASAEDLLTSLLDAPRMKAAIEQAKGAVGRTSDSVAQEVGYDDGTELVLDLMGANRPGQEATARLDEWIKANDVTVPAPEALLDAPDIQAAIDAMGQYYAESLAGVTQTKRRAIAEKAADVFWTMPVREAINVSAFMGETQRAMDAERRAVAKGDFEAALEANTTARTQIEMAKLARKLRDDQAKSDRMIRKLSKVKQGDIEEEHHKNLLALIERFQLARVPTRNGKPLVDYTQKLPLEAVLSGDLGSTMNDDIGLMGVAAQYSPELRDERNSGSWRDMDASAYDELIRLAKFLNDRGRGMARDFVMNGRVSAARGAEQMIERSSRMKSVNRQTHNRIFGSQLQHMREFGASLKQMPFVFRTMDGTAPGQEAEGPFWDLILKPLAEQDHAHEQLMRDLREKIREPMEAYERARSRLGSYPVTSVPVPEVYAAKYGSAWTLDQIFSVALNMGTQHNMDSVAAGMGFRSEDGEIDTSALFELTQVLGKEEWQAIQQIWEVVDSLWPQLAEQHKRINYYTPGKVKADQVAVRTNTGEVITLAGGYYPLKFDAALSDVQAGQEELADLQNTAAAAIGPVTANKGFTKARAGISGKPVQLNTTTLTTHLQYVSRYITHAKTVQDVYRMLSKQAMRNEIKRVWGDEVARQINPWLRGILGTETEQMDGLGRIVNGLRPYVTAYYLFANVKTAVLQTAAIGDLVAEVGAVRYARGVVSATQKLAKDPLGFIRWLDEVSPMMESRRTSREREVEETRKRAGMTLGANKLKPVDATARMVQKGQKAATDFFAFMLAAPAWMVEVPAWLSVYETEVARNGGDAQAAAALANERIVRSQPSLRKMDMAQMQRSRQGAHTLMTFFSSFAFTFGNRNAAAYRAMRNQDMSKLEYAKYVAIQAWLVPAMTALGWAALWGRDFEDDEERDQTAKEVAIEAFTYQFQGIPIVNQAVRGIVNLQAGEWAGDPWRSPAFSVVEKAYRTTNNLLTYSMRLDDPDARDDALWSLYEMASIVSKVPASQIHKRLGEGLRQVEEEDASWPSLFIPDPEKRR